MDGLTGDDLARALGAVQIAQNWCNRLPESDYQAAERAAYLALNLKISAILDEAFPESNNADGSFDTEETGDQVLLRFAPRAVNTIQKEGE